MKQDTRKKIKVRINRRENEGQDIIVPDEYGIDWQIQDGKAVLVPESIINNLKDAIIIKHVKNKETNQVDQIPTTRYIIQFLRDDEPLDGDKENKDEVIDGIYDEITKASANRARAAEIARAAKNKDNGSDDEESEGPDEEDSDV